MKFVLVLSSLLFFTYPQASNLKGKVKIDGSSTVFPISEAVAESFRSVEPRVRVTVGTSGTGGGFKKFSNGEIAINDASRKIKDSELKKLKEKGINFIELPVARDGISVVVNKKNDWVDFLTKDELHKIWKPGSQVKLWSDIRPNWPKKKIILYGPGTDSGTFDYFSKVINKKSGAARGDFTRSEDDNMLVRGVSGDKYSLGFFGFAYFKANQASLNAVAIKENPKAPAILPSEKTIATGSYKPLSRQVYIYVNTKKLKESLPLKTFVNFYLDQVPSLSKQVGYVALPQTTYAKSKKEFNNIFIKK